MNLSSYLEQHKSIGLEIDKIKEIVKRNDFEEHIDEIVHCINTLAGRLKIHLLNEDKYNTKSKFLINKADFRTETDVIIRKIENRIKKEENGLYKLIL